MTFTYDLDTDIGKVRLAIGDTTETGADLTDEEIQVYLDQADSWQEAAVRCVDVLIALYSRKAIDVTVGPLRRAMNQMIENLQTLQARLAAQFDISLLPTLGADAFTFSWNEEEDEDGEYSSDD